MSAFNPILNAREYIEHFLKILTKSGDIIPFHLNEPQRRLYETIRAQWAAGKPVRIIILKARQMGFSTLTEAIIFWMAATAFNTKALIVAHTEDQTTEIFRMAQRFYEHLPKPLKPLQRISSAKELVFNTPSRYRGSRKGLGSSIRCQTAGGQGIGRGSTFKALHLSEFAFWPGDKLATLIGLMQAVPALPGTLIIIESTANGYEEFKHQWDAAVAAQEAGIDGFVPVFFAWYEMQEYRRKPEPDFKRTPEEEELAATYNLDDSQLAWRRWAIVNMCGSDMDKFRQEYPCSPDEAFIATGACFFDKEKLVLRREQVKGLSWETGSFRLEYGYDGRIISWAWEPDPKGSIRILQHPEDGVPYVIGGDTAGEGSDFFVGQVLDNRTGRQVAVLRHSFGEREYAEQMYALGHYYNEALIGIETNFSTFPEKYLEMLGYTRLYVRESLDNYTGKLKQSYGFHTDSRSRPLCLDGLKDVAAHSMDQITDYGTLGEMLVFVKNEQGRPEAEVGEHDDRVMALAIALFIRSQQTTRTEQQKKDEAKHRSKWTEDMWQDYRNGDPTQQKMMRDLWGDPE